MKAVIQHNFTSGIGDCIVSISEYIATAKNLKSIGFTDIDLKVCSTNNLYYNNLNLFDLFDKKDFEIFDTIEYISYPIQFMEDYSIAHLSYGAKQPGIHWWDLFVTDNNKHHEISQFPHTGYNFINLPHNHIIHFSKDVHEICDSLNIDSDFSALHIRSQDLDNNISLYSDNIEKIKNIYQENNKILVCSNSYSLKQKLLNNPKTIQINHPLEDSMGSHHCFRNTIPNDIAKQKTLMTLVEILALSYANKIYLLTSWHRTSNFLFYPAINRVPINIL